MVEEDQKETISINNNDLFNNNNIDIDSIPWIISKYVFENNHEHGYKLHKGDIFKLGKYILRVRELGIDDDKKHVFFENKNTQKYMKDRSLNNISQMPLNQPGENYFSALNLNQIINVQRKEDSNNNNGNSDNNENSNNSHNNNDSNNNENGSVNNENIINNNENKSIHNSNNIQIVKNESSSSQSNNNIKIVENGNNNLDNNFDPITLINKNKDDDKKENKENKENNENNENKNSNNNANRDISVFYSNNPSIKNSNNCQSQHYNEIISVPDNDSQINSNNKNSNLFFINIITNNDIENNNNINNNLNILDDSKNKINNNSLNMNSLRINTFHNNSVMNSSMNASGKNVTNFNNDNEIESSKKNMNINNNNNNNNNNNINCHIIKSNFTALRSTASFKKKKLTNITQKKLSKNSETITEKNNKPICRICLSEEYEENNPLIHPCNCDGTMKYIHLQCLKLLIQSKIKKTETESCKVFTFKTLECEICKMVFPEKIKIKGTVFYIIDLEKPDKDYIILDGLIKETPEEKSIFIVHFKDKKEIKIGRATDANIRLSDISVSRAHAVISQYNDSFYLHDTNSKFGTLISAGNKFCILYNKPFSVQKGNILFEFLMKKTLCATLRCYHPSVVFYKTYNDFLDETFIYKYQTKEESMLIPEKTKSVSEYSSHVIKLKPANSRFESSKINDIFGENNENENNNDSDVNINKKKNSLSFHSREDMKNSMNNKSPNNSIENNKKSNKFLKNDANNNSFFDSFKIEKEKGNNIVNNAANYSSFGVNKTQEISNIYQKNEAMKSNNSKMGITIENQGNENSLLVNNV